ncbi:MAG: type II toxin-antitoxin system RelE/ParE family toxin [Geminicoccaceae bacterium]
MAYRLSRKAEEDLLHVYLDGANRFGLEQADRYHDHLTGLFEMLSDNPRMARERHELSPPVRIHPGKAHIIVYIVDEQGDILILRVRHGRENW